MNLSQKQQQVVQHDDGALLVVAGPGSGKTRVLTERIRRLIAESDGHFRVLALTFTNKAANEMRERLEEFPEIHQRAFIGTLHSFCVEVLANRGKAVGMDGMPNLFEQFQDRKQVLRQAVKEDPELSHEWRTKGDVRAQDKTLLNWLNAISDAKSRLLVPDAVDDPLLRRLYIAYDEGLRRSNAVDYDDLLLLSYRLFVERPKIASFYRRLYRYICVDEAQDLNEAQYRVIQALCGEAYRNVMMVGDPKQAIFQWNGAHPKYLELFEQNFSAKKFVLNENFRSSAVVVEMARKLDPKYEVEGEYPIKGKVNFIQGEDEEDEARQVIQYLEQLISAGHPDVEGAITFERCAILGRNRYVFNCVETLLAQQGWPCYKQLSTQHESESTLLQDFELCLRLLSNPGDRLHLEVLLNRWSIDEHKLANGPTVECVALIKILEQKMLEDYQHAVLDAIRQMEYDGTTFHFRRGLSRLEEYANRQQEEDERAMILQDIAQWRKDWDLFVRSEAGGKHSLRVFLGQIALGVTQQPREDGLALLTVHSSKGLEFDVVVVMGMMEGVFPDYRATGQALEEEKRNLFVATTRSKRLLCFSYAMRRVMPWGDSKPQAASRFLKELGFV